MQGWFVGEVGESAKRYFKGNSGVLTPVEQCILGGRDAHTAPSLKSLNPIQTGTLGD